MPKVKIIIKFSLDLFFHITADRLAFGIDKANYLEIFNENIPAIPASTIKGILRQQIEKILRAKGKNICYSSRPEKMCSDNKNICLTCKYFGSPRIRSTLCFEDINIKNSYKDIRFGVGINRKTKTAIEGNLFSYELGFGREFVTEINGFIKDKEEALMASTLLFLGAKFSFAIGCGKSRGLGWIKLTEFEAFLDQIKISKEEIYDCLKVILKA